jgi:hypothetical protein
LDKGEIFVELEGEVTGNCCAWTFGTNRVGTTCMLEIMAIIAKLIKVIMIDRFVNLVIDEQQLSLDLFISTFYSIG